MTDIEERARQFVNENNGADNYQYFSGVEKGYIQGATDQQKIDIEKALRLYRDALHKLVAVLDPTINAPEEAYDRCVEDFKQAMEE